MNSEFGNEQGRWREDGGSFIIFIFFTDIAILVIVILHIVSKPSPATQVPSHLDMENISLMVSFPLEFYLLILINLSQN